MDLVAAYGRACARSNPSTVMIDFKHEELLNYIIRLEKKLAEMHARSELGCGVFD